MKFKGKAWKFGADVDTDAIIPARYLNTSDPDELASHCMEDSTNPEFMKKMNKGDVIVAGKNFGCGSSREQACSCLKGHELTVVARGFARIFLQNSVNLGLNLVTAPDYEAAEGDELELTPEQVVNRTTGKSFAVVPLPKARQAIVEAGGLIAYTRKRVMELGRDHASRNA